MTEESPRAKRVKEKARGCAISGEADRAFRPVEIAHTARHNKNLYYNPAAAPERIQLLQREKCLTK